MTVYIGIDIASKKFDAAELCDGAYRCKAFENTPLDLQHYITGSKRTTLMTKTVKDRGVDTVSDAWQFASEMPE